MFRSTLAALAVTGAAALATPAPAAEAEIAVTGAWSRASVGTIRPGVVYFTLANRGDAPLIVTGIETDVAKRAMVHRTLESDDGTMRMEPAGPVRVSPGESVKLQPGGLHGMLMKLTEPLEEGDSYSLRILFETADPVEITVPVRPITATGPDG